MVDIWVNVHVTLQVKIKGMINGMVMVKVTTKVKNTIDQECIAWLHILCELIMKRIGQINDQGSELYLITSNEHQLNDKSHD